MIYYNFTHTQEIGMSLELTINTDFLQMLDPPISYPPNEQELAIQIQTKFLTECERFISNEKMLYKCSKSIQNRLKNILNTSESIRQNLSSQKQKFISISSELQKYKEQKQVLREKEKVLKMLCDLIKMEEMRKDLFVGEKPQLGSKMQPVNEEDYLGKLEKLSKIMEDASALAEFREEFPLIKDITGELENIFSQAINYLLKELMTPKMVELALNRFSPIFFGENQSDPRFYQALIRNRVNFMKISLNPMINSLNYASNIPELYESILTSWIGLIQQEVSLFSFSKQYSIMRAANDQLMAELIPKMEKNIFRIKELVQVVRIRKYFWTFMTEFDQIEQLKNKENPEAHKEMILSLLSKCEAIIQSQLTSESESLQNSKYNIYTLVSYIPIREHLQKLKNCYEFSLSEETMDWQVAFYNLFSSRDPKNYPNNKSLIIFNLNIWYLYLKLISNGKYRKEGEELVLWCKNTFTGINVQETNKKYYPSFQKMLEIGGNFAAFKNSLFSEIQLLGHEDLRKDLSESISRRYLQGYEQILFKIDKKPMSNEEVKAFCTSKKINLNKFGKFSQSVCIFSKEELSQLLEYN